MLDSLAIILPQSTSLVVLSLSETHNRVASLPPHITLAIWRHFFTDLHFSRIIISGVSFLFSKKIVLSFTLRSSPIDTVASLYEFGHGPRNDFPKTFLTLLDWGEILLLTQMTNQLPVKVTCMCQGLIGTLTGD